MCLRTITFSRAHVPVTGNPLVPFICQLYAHTCSVAVWAEPFLAKPDRAPECSPRKPTEDHLLIITPLIWIISVSNWKSVCLDCAVGLATITEWSYSTSLLYTGCTSVSQNICDHQSVSTTTSDIWCIKWGHCWNSLLGPSCWLHWPSHHRFVLIIYVWMRVCMVFHVESESSQLSKYI